MADLDRLDAEILGRLSVNARMGVAELAGALGVARNTVQARLRRLEDEGVLRGYGTDVDLRAAGLHVQAFVAIELDQKRLPEVIAALRDTPEVVEVVTQAGREDLLARVAAPDHPALQAVVTGIIALPAVRHTTTTLAVGTPVRYRVQPLLEKITRTRGWGRSTPAPDPNGG
ncbi:Lrp/AsnC family transcriptional regulator [Nocardioides sp. CPCC 205120]|uniref:Lrp/AsnC family transcriptional regulator n=1 Tax=Nocardioides sp. CPCC 205120 TaxID=3406462 RepID=UPI003B5136D4